MKLRGKPVFQFQKVFSRLSLTILIFVFAVTAINTLASSMISSKVIRNEAYKANRTFLNKLSRLVENKMEEINKILISFSYRELKSPQKLDALADDYFEQYTFQNILNQQLLGLYPFIDSIYFYMDDGSNVLVNSPGRSFFKVMDSSQFFDYSTYTQFLEKGISSQMLGARTIQPNYFYVGSSNLNTTRVFSYFRKIHYTYSQTKDTMVVNIDQKYLLKLLEDHYVLDDSILYVYDQSGSFNLFYYNGTSNMRDNGIKSREDVDAVKEECFDGASFSSDVNGEKYYFTTLVSETNGWTYLLALPEREMYKPINSVNVSILIVCNLIIILGIIFSRIVDGKFFQPVVGILSLLKNRDAEAVVEGTEHRIIAAAKTKNDEFTQIKGYIEDLISSNESQKRQLDAYFSFYKERQLHALLNGGYEISKMLDEDKILLKSEFKYFCVILLSVGCVNAEESNGKTDKILGHAAQKLISALSCLGQVDMVQISGNKLSFLICMENQPDISEIKEKLRNGLEENRDRSYTIKVGVGNVYDSVQNIHQSFADAEKAFQHMSDNDDQGVKVKSAGTLNRNSDLYNRELIEKVVNYIQSHYMENIGLNIIADYVYLSPSYLGKIFKEVAGHTFTDYLIEVRMNVAAGLITEGNIRISDIVEKVGYYSIQSFSRVFKSYYGCSPSDYRRDYAQNKLKD